MFWLFAFVAEISTAQPAFHTFPRTFTSQSCFHVNKSLASLTFANEKEISLSWKSLIIPKRVKNFTVCQPEISKQEILIRAVASATLESKRVVRDGNCAVSKGGRTEFGNSQVDAISTSSDVELASSSGDSEEVDERERLRRERISKANKGNTPWNKGRKHSAGKISTTSYIYTL